MNALRVEFGPDRRDALVSTAQSGRQPTGLQRRDLVARRGLDGIEQALVRRFAYPHYDGPTPSGAQARLDPGMSPPSSTRVANDSPVISQARPPIVKRTPFSSCQRIRLYWPRKFRSVSLKRCVASRCPKWPTPSNTTTLASAMRAASDCASAAFWPILSRSSAGATVARRVVVVGSHDEQRRTIDERDLVRDRLGVDHLVRRHERLQPARIFAALHDLIASILTSR